MIDRLNAVGIWTEASRLLDVLILAIPVAVLLTLLFVLSRVRRRAKSRRASNPSADVVRAFGAYDNKPDGQPDRPTMTLETEPQPEAVPAAAMQPMLARMPIDVGVEPVAAPPAHPLDPAQLSKLQAQLQTAETDGPVVEIAPLYMQVAQHCRQIGDDEAALEAVRKAAGYGALHGPPTVHATARLELAEHAFAAGDLTTACEHWQMARDAFETAGAPAARADVEARMKKQRCPTDWVLNDF